MKRFFSLIILGFFASSSCQKELNPDEFSGLENAVFSLPASGTSCLGAILDGIYTVDSTCGSGNTVTINVNVTSTGKYSINTSIVNGIKFSAEGSFTNTGADTVTLVATGTPLAPGDYNYLIDAAQGCSFTVTVNTPTPNTATYALAGAPGACAPITVAGNYQQGVALSAANTAVVSVDVTTPGDYYLSTNAVNGIVFKASGTFASSGVQSVTLQGSGTPSNAGTNTFTPQTGSSSCTFSVSVASNAVPAVFTLAGAPGNCTGAVIGGVYKATIPLTASNTATVSVDVTTAGAYTLSTNTVNGITFSASGTFASTGIQNVILAGSGTPVTAGANTFTPQTGGSQCSFTVNVILSASALAAFTLNGAPGACTGAAVFGIYSAGNALTSANAVVLQVNVTTPGDYNITTAIVNGFKFSGTGVFTVPGPQSVTLTGSGSPTVPGNTSFTPLAVTTACSFDIAVATAPIASGTYSCKIDGVLYNFTDRAEATLVDASLNNGLFLDGFTDPPNGNNIPEFQIFINKLDNSAVTPGTYNVDGLLSPNPYRIEIDFTAVNPDMSVVLWNTSTTFLTTNPPFTITVTSITATRAKGTFSGKLTDLFLGSTNEKTVTEGVFDLPIH